MENNIRPWEWEIPTELKRKAYAIYDQIHGRNRSVAVFKRGNEIISMVVNTNRCDRMMDKMGQYLIGVYSGKATVEMILEDLEV